MDYYTHEKISNRVYRIKDAFGVAMYLVVGDNYNGLIDTGCGLKGLREYVENISDLPTKVLITHGHIDHALGCYEFDEVYMNSLDKDVYEAHSDWKYRKVFLEQVFKSSDNIQLQEKREVNFKNISDCDEIDLGGIDLKAFHVPGHTQGTMMVLIKEERMILFGDACGPGTILLEEFSTDIKTYLNALLRIKKIENDYDVILRNHGVCESPKELLDNVIELCNEILNGKDDKIELPFEMGQMFPVKSNLKMYKAKKTFKTEVGESRVDGKEGNLSYREDKIR